MEPYPYALFIDSVIHGSGPLAPLHIASGGASELSRGCGQMTGLSIIAQKHMTSSFIEKVPLTCGGWDKCSLYLEIHISMGERVCYGTEPPRIWRYAYNYYISGKFRILCSTLLQKYQPKKHLDTKLPVLHFG